jgi:hypothetical protein
VRTSIWADSPFSYFLEEYFGIDIRMKVIDLEFWILFVLLEIWKFKENYYKVLFGRVFWNWCRNKTYGYQILDFICVLSFTNAITNLFHYNIWIQNSKFLLKLITNKVLLVLSEICWDGFEIWHYRCDGFLKFLHRLNLWVHFCNATFKL